MDRSQDKFFNEIHRLGRFSIAVVILSFILVPVLMSVIFKVPVDVKNTSAAVVAILSFMAPLAVGEFLGYAPVLGPSMYLSLMTGNTVNIKIPVVVSGLNIAGAESNSKEGEIVKIIAIGVSSLVVLVLLFVGMIGFGAIAPILQAPILQPAFSNVLPCMMGGLLIPILMSNPKAYIVPVGLVFMITLVLGYAKTNSLQAFVIVGVLAVTTLWEYFNMKRNAKKKDLEANA